MRLRPRNTIAALPTVGSSLCLIAALACAGLAVIAPGASSVARGETVGAADTSRAAREEAARAIPFDQLTPEIAQKLLDVVRNPTIFRRMPQQVVQCDPDLYVFLVRYPEVVVNMWQLMDITKVKVNRIGDYTLDTMDGAGTFSKVELVYGTPDIHVLYAEGHYNGSLVRRQLTGRSVLVLRSSYRQGPNGRVLVGNTLDVFVQLDNVGAELVARTIHPIIGRTADKNFEESTRFVSQISQQAEVNGPGMQRLAARLTSVTPAVREKFASITAKVSERAQETANVSVGPAFSEGSR